jgi:hypothetical protein
MNYPDIRRASVSEWWHLDRSGVMGFVLYVFFLGFLSTCLFLTRE